MGMVTVLAVTVLVATLAQGYLHFGSAGRVTLLLGSILAACAAFWRCIMIPLRWDPSDKEVARYLETHLPELGNSLINTILLTERADDWSGVLVELAIREAAAGARGVDLMAAVSGRKAKRWSIAAVAAAAALGLFVLLGFGRFSSAALQLLMPLTKVASVGDVRFASITPGNTTWIKGEPLDIEAVIADPRGKAYEGVIEIIENGGAKSTRHALVRGPDRLDRFTFRVPQVLQPFTYALNVGDTESPTFKVALREAPLIEKVDVVYNYPAYTALAPLKVDNCGGEIRCLIGTVVDMTVHVSSPIEGATLLFGGGANLKCLPTSGGRGMTTRFTVLANDTYQIHMGGQAPDGAAVTYRIFALEDQAPAIQFTRPGRDSAAGVGETVKMTLKAGDRYGLGEVRLMTQADGEAAPRVLASWKKFADPKDALVDHALVLDAAHYKLGQTVTYWAEALDRRTYQGGATPKGPNLASTAKFKLVLEDKKAAADEKLKELTRLYDRLREILQKQQQARAATDAVAGAPVDSGTPQKPVISSERSESRNLAVAVAVSPRERQRPQRDSSASLREGRNDNTGEATQNSYLSVRTAGTNLDQAQKTIRDATLAVIKDVKFDADTAAIRETLAALTTNEMASAMTKARAIGDAGAAAKLATLPDLAKSLAADQDAIIGVLRRILDIVPKLADAIKEEQKRMDPSDLPPDLAEKLKALRDKLKEFANEQKKVIEASKELAKKPVDDFQQTDQRDLEKLKAIEDQWDKFLTEAIADFSKIPEVDAANPSLVKELIEVKTDVEMAADALSKKAVNIAVPLEELGMEGAEELVENLEKWLPDTPDRAKWSQEEFTKDVEIPHAELPQEMEDLVGDLLEQEEDLFEEMQDVTAGAADSPDKGAGWDAMDGPISSFAAKGVTGNQLPNSSEIGGRSGEGRSGKSSGEFVEEEATGKGGRRTPTRLSPDAFSKGEVKDSSPESTGGATGGGKISGGGSEGLEGPVPPEVQRRMGNLAGKQAQLRNKAEGVKAALQVRNYDSFALDQAMEGMRRTQRDLLAGRYQSALRQKDVVLDNLKGTKMLLSGEVRIRKDSSAAIPTEVQKDVLDAMEKPMPRGYEDYLKQYYQRLSEGK